MNIQLINPTFINVSRLFVVLFAKNPQGDHKVSFPHYSVLITETKNIKVLIDGKIFFDLPVKYEEETYKNINERSRKNDYTNGNLLHCVYFKENYRLIGTDLSKYAKLKNYQQINFIGTLEVQNNGATMFFIIEKSEETAFEFLENSVNIS